MTEFVIPVTYLIMREAVYDYVSSFVICQRYNHKNIDSAGKLIHNKIMYPLARTGLDLIDPCPLPNPDKF